MLQGLLGGISLIGLGATLAFLMDGQLGIDRIIDALCVGLAIGAGRRFSLHCILNKRSVRSGKIFDAKELLDQGVCK